jgi:hypothetical protein
MPSGESTEKTNNNDRSNRMGVGGMNTEQQIDIRKDSEQPKHDEPLMEWVLPAC